MMKAKKGHLKIRERIAVWVCRKAIKSLKSIEYTDGIVWFWKRYFCSSTKWEHAMEIPGSRDTKILGNIDLILHIYPWMIFAA
jgi:hypothetical protein